MKFRIVLISLAFFCINGVASQKMATSEPMKVVTRFFDAFHSKDSTALKTMFAKTAFMQTTGIDTEGMPRIRNNRVDQFVKAVTTREASPEWKEVLGEPKIQQHLTLAHVWVPYRFFLNGELLHCGYNSFTLFWNGKEWKITYLIDTRTKKCI